MTTPSKNKIWIDLDNSPHVPFFKPIINELTKHGYSVVVTARDCFQVCGLADLMNLKYKKIGRHYGKNKMMKIIGTAIRALQLIPVGIKEKPALALSHGSRSHVIAASILRIPSVMITDYEYAKEVFHPDWMIRPEVIPNDSLDLRKNHIFRYPGIKEDVYVPEFEPNPSLREELALSPDDIDDIIVTVRPPATEAHYHNHKSEELFTEVMNYLGRSRNTCVILLPRNEKQKAWIEKEWNHYVINKKVIIPDHVIDGLNLIWHSDVVISGGGTMNREAAALSVPVYSIFRGKIGAVDRFLVETGRLTLIETVEDVSSKIKLVQRNKSQKINVTDRPALKEIVSIIENLIGMN